MKYYTQDAIPPVPKDRINRERWAQSKLRKRLLEGAWQQDLLDRYAQHMGLEKTEAHGAYRAGLDQSCNPFKQISTELATLYHEAPDVHHEELEANVWIQGPLASSNVWPMMEWFQSMVLGIREYLIRVDVDGDRVLFRPVAPDLVIADSHPDRPHIPTRIDEYRRRHYDGEIIWTIDRYDVSDPENPIYMVIAPVIDGDTGARQEHDITADVLGGVASGEAYPYRRSDGTPILPWVLYHSKITLDRLWNWEDGAETVEGSLNAAVGFSFLFHSFKTSSWPQKYGVNVAPIGASTDGSTDTPRRVVTADPATVLLFKQAQGSMESPGQPMVGQWSAGADIAAMDAALASYINRLATDAGIPPGDMQRMGGTARSGYAIALSNASKRVAQDRHRIGFQAHDRELVALAATLWNRAHGTTLPEDGYNVAHKPIPLSPQELDARRKNLLELMAAGLISRRDAYRELHPGMDEPHAQTHLNQIDRERLIR